MGKGYGTRGCPVFLQLRQGNASRKFRVKSMLGPQTEGGLGEEKWRRRRFNNRLAEYDKKGKKEEKSDIGEAHIDARGKKRSPDSFPGLSTKEE